MYWARFVFSVSKSSDSKPSISAKLILGPDATGVGWVYSYVLQDKTGQHDLSELRSLQDWLLKYELQTLRAYLRLQPLGEWSSNTKSE